MGEKERNGKVEKYSTLEHWHGNRHFLSFFSYLLFLCFSFKNVWSSVLAVNILLFVLLLWCWGKQSQLVWDMHSSCILVFGQGKRQRMGMQLGSCTKHKWQMKKKVLWGKFLFPKNCNWKRTKLWHSLLYSSGKSVIHDVQVRHISRVRTLPQTKSSYISGEG